MAVKVKDKLKPGSNRSFLAKDFEALRNDLIEHAQVFYPDKIRDFSEPSVAGMFVDIAASIGDTLSFYLDHQFRELDPQSAVEIDNIVTHMRNAGVKVVGAAPAVAEVRVTIKVPVDYDDIQAKHVPRISACPKLLETTSLKSENGVIFNFTEDLDFSEKTPLGELFAEKDFVGLNAAGNPTACLLSRSTIVISGEEVIENVSITDTHVPFREIELKKPHVSEILSVKDTDGNTYYQVESLSQDNVFEEVDNVSRADFDLVPKTLEIIPAPRRFVTLTSINSRKTRLRFGSGDSSVLDDDIIPDPSELALELYGKKSFHKFAIDPNNLLDTQTLGISPRGTTIKIHYRHGGGLFHNVDIGSINTIENLGIEFNNSPSPSDALEVRQSIQTTNPSRARGGAPAPNIEELRALIPSARNAQMRTVTRDDLLARIYTLPARYGRVFRVAINDSEVNPLAVQMHVLSLDRNGNLDLAPDTLKLNLSKYLNEFRLVSDAIDVLDGNVCNIKIKYEVYLDKMSNKELTLININSRIASALQLKYFQIDQPLIIDDIINVILNTEGVVSLTNFELRPITGIVDGRQYSDFEFGFEARTKNGIIRPPTGCIFELKFPENDITGTAI